MFHVTSLNIFLCDGFLHVTFLNRFFCYTDRDAPASPALEQIAEDGAVGPLSADFLATDGAVWDGTVIGMIDGNAGPLVP